VSDSDVESFQRDGFAILRGGLTAGDVARLAELIADHRSEHAPEAPGSGNFDAYGDVNSGASRDFFAKVPSVAAWQIDAGLPDAAAELLGTERARVVRDRLFVKEPNGGERTMWHQDQPLTEEAQDGLVVLWIPLAIDENAAPLVIARGSQHGPEMIESGIAWYRDYLGAQGAVVEASDIEETHEVVTARVSVGDVVALHGGVLHASEPNHSGTERVALSVRLVPA
jgi:hypothetical protein